MTDLLIYSPPRDVPVRHGRALALLVALVAAIAALTSIQARRAACTVWTAADEPVYVTDWQRAHCGTLTYRDIPTTGGYNP